MPSDKHRLEPRRRPAQVRAELTRGRILAAAAHIFAEYGYAAGTTNRIAERARVSIGSLYQYFPNKDAILLELLLQHIDDGDTGDPLALAGLEDTVRAIVRRAIDNHRADPQLLRIMIVEAPRSPDLVEKVLRYEEARVAQIRAFLARHPQVKVGDVDAAARLVVSTVELVTHKMMATPEDLSPQRYENELVAMLTRYLSGGGGDDDGRR
ncbi:TetR/AcrR family transcriptional regulator [Dactylosporangium sp. CA-092794]|uniref:TetR/AcrR family transcriptional regulator n=1 Tax=Dactylosporangium sp. CA-092794 TaxID=3239929 RepID=UPI003D8DE252